MFFIFKGGKIVVWEVLLSFNCYFSSDQFVKWQFDRSRQYASFLFISLVQFILDLFGKIIFKNCCALGRV